MAAATTTGDFKGKQFDKSEVADKVVEQYDEAHARVFYKYVMVCRFNFNFSPIFELVVSWRFFLMLMLLFFHFSFFFS